MVSRSERVKRGAFFTGKNPLQGPFNAWLLQTGVSSILEPCAGDGALRRFVDQEVSGLSWTLYDIDPQSADIHFRDSIKDFPKGFECCITNPPYLSPRRARKIGMSRCHGQDLWKIFLELALVHCRFVAMVLPQSFIKKAGHYRRLSHIILLPPGTCDGTEQPVCLALFDDIPRDNVVVWSEGVELGDWRTLRRHQVMSEKIARGIRINDVDGQIGLHAMDSRTGDSLRFVKGEEIDPLRLKRSSRHVTRIFVEGLDAAEVEMVVNACNELLGDIRHTTSDLLLTPAHGTSRNGTQRRRLTYRLAVRIISCALRQVQSRRLLCESNITENVSPTPTVS
jgi:hypothetical protein